MADPPNAYAHTAVTFAIHEGFHLWAQSTWPVNDDAATAGEAWSRDPDYPDVWQLRYLRSQVLRAMQASLDDGAPLGNAAYWNRALHTERASEVGALAWVDALEGSAQYASTIATILGKRGCDADDETIVADVKSTFLSGESYAAGWEPYDLGLVALLLLRTGGSERFEAKIETGTPPVDALLDGVKPVAQTKDLATENAAKTKIEAVNAAAAKWIEPLLTRLKSPKSVRLTLPTDWIVGAFLEGDAYHVVNEPGRPLATQLESSTMKDPTSGVIIELTNVDVIEDVSNPCGKESEMWVLPLDAAGITLESGKLTAKTSHLDITALPVVVKSDAAGLQWACPADP